MKDEYTGGGEFRVDEERARYMLGIEEKKIWRHRAGVIWRHLFAWWLPRLSIVAIYLSPLLFLVPRADPRLDWSFLYFMASIFWVATGIFVFTALDAITRSAKETFNEIKAEWNPDSKTAPLTEKLKSMRQK